MNDADKNQSDLLPEIVELAKTQNYGTCWEKKRHLWKHKCNFWR